MASLKVAQRRQNLFSPTACAKYEYIALTDSLKRILECKQGDEENLLEYTKKFKQARDILKDSVGTDILHGFVEKTSEYQATTKVAEKEEMKKKSLSKWTTYLYMVNSNKQKYGSLLKHFRTQYSLGNNQYCDSLTTASNVLTNHIWDDTYKESIKKKKQLKQKMRSKARKKKRKKMGKMEK